MIDLAMEEKDKEMHKEFLRMYEYPIGDIWKDRVASGSITFLP